MEFYRTLKSAVAKRMYRFLDKKFHFSHEWRCDLAQFAHEHVGLSRNYDAAQLKRRLNPAIKELEDTGYLKPLSAENGLPVFGVVSGRSCSSVRKSRIGRKVESSQPVGLEARLIERGVTRFDGGSAGA